MNAKKCKVLRARTKANFPNLPERQLIAELLGKKQVKRIRLDEHGKQVVELVQVQTQRAINHPHTQRAHYLALKRAA